MTPPDEEPTLDAGEWGLFVARAVQDIRRELGEAAANRVSSTLLALKSEAVEAASNQLAATRELLARAIAEVGEARMAHERLQADVARMEAAVREAKSEAARVRADATDFAMRRRAESDAAAEAEAQRCAAAWEEIRAHEADLARRRSELLDLDEHATRRLAEIDLRDGDPDLDDREEELREWEADLVARAKELEEQAASITPMMAPPEGPVSGWGRPRSRRP